MASKSTSRLAIQMTLDGVSSVLGGARSVVGGIGSIGGALRKMSQDVFYGLSNLRMLQDLAAKPIEIITSVVQANASRETAVLQFQTLLGSAEAAQAQIKELAAFAANTPFELPEILNAARTLQTFGKSALNNKKALTSIGDAAAASGKPFEEVAFWVGRMYGSLGSGQPFAEAINRFTEMAVIGPETAAALRKISDEGTGTAETINLLFAGMDQQGAGGMKRLSGSFSGMVSTMKDNWNEIKIMIGEGLFASLKDDVEAVNAAITQGFESGSIKAWAAKASEAVKGVYEEMKSAFAGGIGAEDLMNAAEQGKLGALLKEQLKDVARSFGASLMEMAVGQGPRFAQALMGGEGSFLSSWSGTDWVVQKNEIKRAKEKDILQQGKSYKGMRFDPNNLTETDNPVLDAVRIKAQEKDYKGPSFTENLASRLNEAYDNLKAQTKANMEMAYGVNSGGGQKTDINGRLADIAMAEKMRKTETAMENTAQSAEKLNRAIENVLNQPALLYGR